MVAAIAVLIIATPRTHADETLGPAVDAGGFSRATLLRQFDRNGDSVLSSDERVALRNAFGGIDVPMLPTTPYHYAKSIASRGIDVSVLSDLDNTPIDNPITDAGAALGRVLFYDTQLSRNNTIACASCHVQEKAFADPRRLSVGFQGGRTQRNAMGLANVRYTHVRGGQPGFFWDERAATLEEQVLMPIQDKTEMGMKLSDLEQGLASLPYYPALFTAAFGSPEITSARIAQAIAQFMRSMESFDSKFDRAARSTSVDDDSVDFESFTAEENLGKSLFVSGVGGVGEIGCAHCHVPPSFGMPKSFNNGLDIHYADRGLGMRDVPANDPFTPTNDGKFKAPTLRNVGLTAPYMHDGRFETLEQVVEHYSRGVHPHPNVGLAFGENSVLQNGTSGFGLSDQQKSALVAFLKTLTDETFISDPRLSDPFVRDDPYQRLLDEFQQEGGARLFAKRFLRLYEQHPRNPTSIKALTWVVQNVRGRPETTQALKLLRENHIGGLDLEDVLPHVAQSRSTAAKDLLSSLVDQSPHKHIRAQACQHLANLLDGESVIVEQLAAQPDMKPRVLQYYGNDYGQYLSTVDPRVLSKRREDVYQRMLDSFAAVMTGDSTMGDVARDKLFAIRHLSVGCVAPEIEGEDISGLKFKLSDFRGKVVMITFWGHW